MDKHDVLERNRNNPVIDEGLLASQNRARLIGFIFMMGLIVAMMLYNLFNGLPTKSFLTLIMGYIGFENISLFITTKKKLSLVISIASLAASAVFFIMYIIQTR